MTYTKGLAHVRIHVERTIRRLKVYKILLQVVPITMAPKIGKILKIGAVKNAKMSTIITDQGESLILSCSSARICLQGR